MNAGAQFEQAAQARVLLRQRLDASGAFGLADQLGARGLLAADRALQPPR